MARQSGPKAMQIFGVAISRSMITAAVLGIVISVALHFYFVMRWSAYLYSVPGYPDAFRNGRPPDPHMASSPGSRLHGAVVLFLAGIVLGAAVRRQAPAAVFAFSLAVGASFALLLFTSFAFPGNLWPLDVVGTVIVSVLPALLGGGIGIAVVRVVRGFRPG